MPTLTKLIKLWPQSLYYMVTPLLTNLHRLAKNLVTILIDRWPTKVSLHLIQQWTIPLPTWNLFLALLRVVFRPGLEELIQNKPVADPGFSRGRCANSQKCYYFSIFCRKLHENERIWTNGGRPLRSPWIRQSKRLNNWLWLVTF